MIIDNQLQLSSAQAVTASAASSNYLDLGSARAPGVGGELRIAVTVTAAATAAGAATVQFQLQSDSDPAFGTVKTEIETDAIPKATLAAGYQFFIPIPVGLKNRYVRLNYNVGTGPLTAGAFSAAIVQGEQLNSPYADALSVP